MVTGKLVCTPFPTPTHGTLFGIMKIIFITVQTEDKPFMIRPSWIMVTTQQCRNLLNPINAAMKKEIGSDNKITFTFNPRTEKTGVTLAPSY